MAAYTIIQRRQIITFILTWIAYASSYLLRKPLGVVKSDLESTYSLSKTELGWLDTCLLLPYAVMQLLLGNLGDKYGPRVILSLNLFMSALSMVTFGAWKSPVILGILLFINGSAQATCWPNCVKALSDWYTDQQRATIFGIWGTCTFAGGIFGTFLAVQLQRYYSPDLKMVFAVPALCVFFVAFLQYLFLRSPEALGIDIPGKELPRHVTSKPMESKNMTFFNLWKIRLLPEIAWTMFCMKLVRYCLYMWLPLYLYQNLNYGLAEAGILSTTFEVGGVVGSALVGVFIDRVMQRRTHWAVFLLLVLCSISLALFQMTSHWGKLFNMSFIFLAGVCNCGPDAIVSGSLAVEIGNRENAQSAVSGFVNGFGSFGTIIEGPLIGFIAQRFGWGGTFYVMVALSVLSSLCMLRSARENDKISSPVL